MHLRPAEQHHALAHRRWRQTCSLCALRTPCQRSATALYERGRRGQGAVAHHAAHHFPSMSAENAARTSSCVTSSRRSSSWYCRSCLPTLRQRAKFWPRATTRAAQPLHPKRNPCHGWRADSVQSGQVTPHPHPTRRHLPCESTPSHRAHRGRPRLLPGIPWRAWRTRQRARHLPTNRNR